LKIHYTLAFISVILTGCAHTGGLQQTNQIKPVQVGYAPVNGLQMYYEIYGQGQPLVLIHGGGSTIESNFSRLIPLLSKDHQLIAIEEQGHGHTKSIDRPFTFENSADDIAALLDYLKIARADVLGFSNGGSIAMRLAGRHPNKVASVIVASAMFRRDGMVKGFWEGMNHVTLENMPKPLQDADRKINPDPKHLDQLFRQDSKRIQSFKDWPESDLTSIQAPTLILIGDQDVITAEHAVKMSRLFPRGRLAILPANHGSYLGEVMSSGPSDRLTQATALIVNEFLAD
jgi:pimeloyl-ACP methyl ester carboxylesterase